MGSSKSGTGLSRPAKVLSHKLLENLIRRRDLRVVLDAVADAGLTREAEQRRNCIGAM